MSDTFVEVSAESPPEQIGWLDIKLPKSVMKRLQSYIEEAKKNPVKYNKNLAGNISKSILLKDKDNWFFKTILNSLISKFNEYYPTYLSSIMMFSENAPYCLDDFWVNFQKENEFNPSHDHAGVFSFVIWIKIPTDWKEQHALPISANSNSPKASNFEFHYTSMLGNFGRITFNLDKTSEGVMLFFPSKLVHTVYPFYNCDKERISISGNILFDISENSMRQYRSQQKK